MAPNGYPVEDVRLELVSRALRTTIPIRVRQRARRGPTPLLLVHDGPEYVRRAGLLRVLDRLPPLRAALIESPKREEDYAASPTYGRALATEILPSLGAGGPRIGVGSSLGALALLHTHRTHPESFDGLLLQSGSYFRRRTDRQESAFPRFARIDRFVGTVLVREPERPIPVTISCGLDEENLENNRAVAAALEQQGYDVRLVEQPGGHTWPNWRRALDTHLEELLCRVT